MLGALYADGGITPQDQVMALELFRRGCDAGDAVGCLRTGKALTSGHGGSVDPVAAKSAYRRACDLGEAQACALLAELGAH
jgi:TPR repeat protein